MIDCRLMLFHCRLVFRRSIRLFRLMSSTVEKNKTGEMIFDPCAGCEIPCDSFRQYPPEISEQIDQGKMIGSVEKHRRHLCIGQPILPSQWPNDVKDLQGGYIKEITRVLKAQKDQIGYAVKLTSAAIAPTETNVDVEETADWFLFPDQIKLINVRKNQIEQVIEKLFVSDQSIIQIKNQPKTIDEQLKERRNLPIFDSSNISVQRLDGVWILVCCHAQRDQRCGVIGPILVEEFEKYIEKNEQKEHVHCLRISHVGGHKFAGNVIVYPSGTWYGRVLTCHVPLLVDAYASSSDELKEKLTPLLRGQLETAW